MTRVAGPRPGARLPTVWTRPFLIDTAVATVFRASIVWILPFVEDQVRLARGRSRRRLAERDGGSARDDQSGSNGGAEKLPAGFLHGPLILYKT